MWGFYELNVVRFWAVVLTKEATWICHIRMGLFWTIFWCVIVYQLIHKIGVGDKKQSQQEKELNRSNSLSHHNSQCSASALSVAACCLPCMWGWGSPHTDSGQHLRPECTVQIMKQTLGYNLLTSTTTMFFMHKCNEREAVWSISIKQPLFLQ